MFNRSLLFLVFVSLNFLCRIFRVALLFICQGSPLLLRSVHVSRNSLRISCLSFVVNIFFKIFSTFLRPVFFRTTVRTSVCFPSGCIASVFFCAVEFHNILINLFCQYQFLLFSTFQSRSFFCKTQMEVLCPALPFS
jgi:hypothetical protein